MSDKRVPRWTPKELSENSESRLILSCIDGESTIEELATLLDQRPEAIAAALEGLVKLGAIAFAATSSSVEEPKKVAAAGEESVEMSPELQEKVRGLYDRLNELDHYALLGVAATSDEKDVKRAYFALAKDFHPDRYFRKNLGSYKKRLEAIFARMTQANDTLSNRARRAEYDRHLTQLLKMKSMRRLALQNEERGQWQAAAEIWTRIAEALPSEADPHHRMARAWLLAGTDYPKAMQAISQAIELDPNRAAYRLTLVHALLSEQHDEAALAELQIAAQLEPENNEVAMLLADVRARLDASGRRWSLSGYEPIAPTD
jgi:tetratricopeptide (TPR) repeat protein